jgi:hypothetical protein
LRFSPPAAAVAACSCGNDVSLAELPNKKETMYSGNDVMIFKIFSPKNLAKKLSFFIQSKAKSCKK